MYLFWLEVYTIWSHKPASNDDTLELCGVVPKNRKTVISDLLPHPSNHDLTKEAAFAMMEVFPCPVNCIARYFSLSFLLLLPNSTSAKIKWIQSTISYGIRLIFKTDSMTNWAQDHPMTDLGALWVHLILTELIFFLLSCPPRKVGDPPPT